MVNYNNRSGQLDGTFAAESNIVTAIRNKHKLNDFKGFIYLRIEAAAGTAFTLNGEEFHIRSTGIYELRSPMYVTDFSFPQETSALLDYIY